VAVGAVVRRLGVVGAGRQSRDIVGRLRLEVEDNETVSDKIMNRVEPLVANEVLPVIVQPVVLCCSFKPAQFQALQEYIYIWANYSKRES